ncbi:MAG: hypothetical protein HC897_20270 [Thermoanaerobaculia bacterium]|nr:hypothetical protein [Thermoanaerobaculia bacterium]
MRYTGTSPIEETYTLRDLGGKALTSYKAIGGNTGTWYWEKDYVYRDGLLLAAESSEPWPKNQQHYVVDHLGTPRLVTGANGSIVAIHHYFGFGEEIGGGSDPERLRFTGHERDFHEAGTEDDLDYMHARYCSPQLARFMSPDSALASAQEKIPQSWNRYSYALNSPVSVVDRDDRVWDYVLDAASIVYDVYTIATEGPTVGNVAGLVADVALGVVPFVPSTGALRLSGDALTAARVRLAANKASGAAFEKVAIEALGTLKNTKSIKVDGLGTSIPDILKNGITEIKAGKEIRFSKQLQIQEAKAKELGVPFSLVVSPNATHIPKKLRAAIDRTGGKIYVFDPDTKTFTPLKI